MVCGGFGLKLLRVREVGEGRVIILCLSNYKSEFEHMICVLTKIIARSSYYVILRLRSSSSKCIINTENNMF